MDDAKAIKALAAEPLPVSAMVVDHDPDAAERMAFILAFHGFAVRSFLNGAAAIVSAALDPPDAIILDVGMPGMNGWEVARYLGAGAKPPFMIAITERGSEADYKRSVKAGIHMHFLKPLDSEVLIDLLKRFNLIPAESWQQLAASRARLPV